LNKIKFNRAYIAITSRCNLDCEYCYLSNDKSNELTTQEWIKTFDKISDQGIKWVQLTGGEPLMREDIWEILRECDKKFDKVILATNATLIDNEISRKLSELKHLILYISLNNWEENQERQSKIEIIKNLKKDGNSVVVLTTISNENFKDIPKIIDFVQKINVPWKIGFLFLRGHATRDMLDPVTNRFLNENKEKIKNEKSKKITVVPPCNAGFSTISIMENGDVSPCVAARDKSFIAGNIIKDDLEKIFNSDVFKKWREETCRIEESCKQCSMFDDCKGGCPIRRLSFSIEFGKDISIDASICAWNQSFERLELGTKLKSW